MRIGKFQPKMWKELMTRNYENDKVQIANPISIMLEEFLKSY